MANDPKTYHDEQIRDRCREVFMEATDKALAMIRGDDTPFNPERLNAYAGLADTAAQMYDSVRGSDDNDDDPESPF